MKEYTLKQQIKNRKRWVKALRSGKYKQGTHRLKSANGLCCLGVLCEVIKVPKQRDDRCADCGGSRQSCDCDQFTKHWTYGAENNSEACPKEAMASVGLAERSGVFMDEGKDYSLASLNDTGATFLEIADIIESDPEGLFIKE